MTTKQYLEKFFEEKSLPFKMLPVEGLVISNEQVVAEIMTAPEREQEQIAQVLRKLDYQNGNINHFLAHLAKALI